MGIDKEGFKRAKGKPSKAEDWGIVKRGSEESEMDEAKFKMGDKVEHTNGDVGVVVDSFWCRSASDDKKWYYRIQKSPFEILVAAENNLRPFEVCFKDGADLEEQYAKQVEDENEPSITNPEMPDVEGFKKLIDDTVVNHPPHYTAGKVECIDALEAATTGLNGIEAVCTANAIKYLWRWKHKNGVEDLRKAQWYISKLIEVCAEQEND